MFGKTKCRRTMCHVSAFLLSILLLFSNSCSKPAASTQQDYVLGIGRLDRYSYKSGRFDKISAVLDGNTWDSAQWPAYDATRDLLYFSAWKRNDGVSVCRKRGLDTTVEPEEMLEGADYPALSPDKNLLICLKIEDDHQLYMCNVGGDGTWKALPELGRTSLHTPVVWISNSSFLYWDAAQTHLSRFDVSSGQITDTGHVNVVPGALSPDGTYVLCSLRGETSEQILKYVPETNELSIFKKTFGRKIFPSFVWNCDGTGFFYARQSWNGLLHLREEGDLFYHSLDGTETRITDTVFFDGGCCIPSTIDTGSEK